MTALSVQAALAIALKCLPPAVAPIMVGIAQHESGLDPAAVHHNANGTDDVGIVQVNSSNFGWTGLTWQSARPLREPARRGDGSICEIQWRSA